MKISRISQTSKKAYHKAARENHPDMGGDLETMKKINNDFDRAARRRGRRRYDMDEIRAMHRSERIRGSAPKHLTA